MIKKNNLDPSLRSLIESPENLGETVWLTGKTSNAYAQLQKATFSDLIHFELASAIDRCTSDQGDKIYVTPKYTETVTGAGGITCDVAGVEIIGLGNYTNVPTFLQDGASITCLITADDVALRNLAFNPGHADIANAFLITGEGCTIDSCRFFEITTDENWVDVIHVSAADNDADGLVLINNEITLTDAAHVTAIDLLKNIKDAKLLGNRIIGDFDATPYAPIYMAVGEVPTNILVKDNYIHNQHDGNAAVGISIACTTATGWIIDNHVAHLDVDGNTAILAGAAGLYCANNYTSSVQGTASGYLYPAADDGAS